MEALLAGRHVLTVMPTGSGKSLCFQVPALVMGGLTLVVSPLVALMQDQVSALKLAGVAADAIHSAQSREENVAIWRRVVRGETRLLYLAPERLMTERMLTALARLDVRLIAIDEAHCISQWGPAFRPEYEALSRLCEIFPDVPIAALTATADEATRADIAQKLFAGVSDKSAVDMLVLGFDRPNIRLRVEPKREWKKQMLHFVRRHQGASGIVYCLSRRKTEDVADYLCAQGVRALPYHAGMSKEQREANQNRFMTEPGIVVVATIAFGMGIDKSDVRFVFHADLPGSLEAYYQEIGRAGRDGAEAEALMLFGLGDIRMRRIFIEQEDAGEDRKRREMQRLAALVGFCEAAQCRRQLLLGYFGEEAEPCQNCDICLTPVAMLDGAVEARLVLRLVSASGQMFGVTHIVDLLRGQKTEKVLSNNHDQLADFGAGAIRKREEWQSFIRQMVGGGLLHLDIAGYGGLHLTLKGEDVLQGRAGFQYRPVMVAQKMERRGRGSSAGGDLSGAESSLLEKLKQLRLALAKDRQVPAYVIFSDRSLADMALRQPRNKDEFGEVTGVGAAKLRDFGTLFLDVITAHRT